MLFRIVCYVHVAMLDAHVNMVLKNNEAQVCTGDSNL